MSDLNRIKNAFGHLDHWEIHKIPNLKNKKGFARFVLEKTQGTKAKIRLVLGMKTSILQNPFLGKFVALGKLGRSGELWGDAEILEFLEMELELLKEILEVGVEEEEETQEKKELYQLADSTKNEVGDFEKLVWKGTSNELGFVIQELQKNDYLPKSIKANKLAKILNNIFWNQKEGEEFNLGTLGRNLGSGNDLTQYPNDWKIPPSSNSD